MNKLKRKSISLDNAKRFQGVRKFHKVEMNFPLLCVHMDNYAYIYISLHNFINTECSLR